MFHNKTEHHSERCRGSRRWVCRSLAIGLVGAGALAAPLAAPALADSPQGTVSTPGTCLNVRDSPNPSANSVNCLPDGTVITIYCQTHSAEVSGNWGPTDVWDHTDGGWVSDGYVYTGHNGLVAPLC